MSRPLTIALIAGETSGDQLGGWLMEALIEKNPNLRFIGLGGPRMAERGLTSIFPMRDISLIGIAEIIPHIRTITRRIKQTVEFLERENPDVIITIDVPGFALRVLKQLKTRGKITSKLVHYVAPTVWAYRPERAKIVAERYDHLLCLLPFEPPYFEKENLPTTFIGHEIAWWWKVRGDGQAFRESHGIASEAPVLAVFPGSREGELNRLWPIFKAAIEQLKREMPNLVVILQVPENMLEEMHRRVLGWQVRTQIYANTQEKKNLFAAATAALAKSGTIGLECALAGLPSVIAYRTNWLTAYIIRKKITIKFANLANILADKMVVPELIQENCTPEKLAASLKPLLSSQAARDAQKLQLTQIANQLGASDTRSPSQKAADVILGMVN